MAFLPTENTKSTLLDKAACVPADMQLLLQDPMTHAGLKEPMVMKECKLTDQLRQIPMSASLGAPPSEEHMLDSIRDGLIKELICSSNTKGQPITPQMKQEPKEEPVTPAKPSTSKKPNSWKSLKGLPSSPILTGKRLLPSTPLQPSTSEKKKATTPSWVEVFSLHHPKFII